MALVSLDTPWCARVRAHTHTYLQSVAEKGSYADSHGHLQMGIELAKPHTVRVPASFYNVSASTLVANISFIFLSLEEKSEMQ